jgi:hypothetical protein
MLRGHVVVSRYTNCPVKYVRIFPTLFFPVIQLTTVLPCYQYCVSSSELPHIHRLLIASKEYKCTHSSSLWEVFRIFFRLPRARSETMVSKNQDLNFLPNLHSSSYSRLIGHSVNSGFRGQWNNIAMGTWMVLKTKHKRVYWWVHDLAASSLSP